MPWSPQALLEAPVLNSQATIEYKKKLRIARGSLSDDEADAAQLIGEVAAELREQWKQEEANLFVSVKKLRTFTKTESPVETANVSEIMLASSRLDSNKGHM